MKKIMLLVLPFLINLISFISADAGGDNFAHHSMMGGIYGYGFMWLFMILIIVALVLLIIWLFKQLQKPGRKK